MGFATQPPLLPEIFALHAKWRSVDAAVCVDNSIWTWAEFMADCHQFGHGLRAIGLMEGDRVGILMSNGYPMLQVIFGAIAAGCVVVPVNLSVSDAAAGAMFEDAQTKVIVASEDLQCRLIDICALLQASPVLIGERSQPGLRSITDVCLEQSVEQPPVVLEAGSLINIIYSSGTTGVPKGIAHSHAGRRDWAADLAIALRYHGGARTLLTIGLYSNISWVAMLATLLAGGCIYVEKKFNEDQFIELVTKHKITHTAMVPIQFQRVIDALIDHPTADLSSMQAMMSCGSPLRENLKQQIFSRFPCGVIELYGLTEGIITTLEPEHAEGRWSSVGRPLIGTDICVLDDQDCVVGPNTAGEICSRGRIAMPSYWRRPEADLAATFIDPDGHIWLRSGDIGYFDHEGFLFIVDRKKDMILSGGQNIFPQDIEAVLVNHDAVFDAAIIGLSSEKWGETPVALVVKREGCESSCAELKAWLNNRVGKQQRVSDVIFIDELPRNPNGKILKRELREQYRDRHYG